MIQNDKDIERIDAVCIVGAGPFGLLTARALKRVGVPYVLIEKHSDVGGLWDIDNPGSPMYDSCHYISSRDGSGYIDFPFPRSYPDYPSRSQILAHLRSFADTYGLREMAEFNNAVTHAEPDGDRWRVTTADGRTRSFEALIACPGSNWIPKMPKVPGSFSGEIIHSVDYRSPDQLSNKRVLIVGLGNTGADIACDGARAAAKTFISTRRGYHFLPKQLFGMPTMDFFKNPENAPLSAKNLDLPAILDVVVGDPTRFGFPKPDHDFMETHPLLNTQILHYALHGRVTPKPGVDRFNGFNVHFTDGSTETVDLVIFATGYQYRVPFLEEKGFGWRDGHPDLHMASFSKEHPALFVLGLLETAGLDPWLLQDQLILLIAEHLKDRREHSARAEKLRHHLETNERDLKEGMNYLQVDRNVNYVNATVLSEEVESLVNKFSFMRSEQGIYNSIRVDSMQPGSAT